MKPLPYQVVVSLKTMPTSYKSPPGNSNRKNNSPGNRSCTRCWRTGKHWLPEITSLIFAVLAFAAIVILLATRQGRVQPKWPSLLNLNTLLSIFTTLLRAFIVFPVAEGIMELKWVWFAQTHSLRDIDRFEAAGRSPWGALKLLCKYPANVLTSVGAIITILSLAIEPFSQQVLKFYSCPQPVFGALSATITRTNNYTVGAFQYAVGDPAPDGKMTAALYQGFLNPSDNASSIISTSCSSGNCTFPDMYSSLAMCSSVLDISSQVTRSGDFNSWAYHLPSGLFIAGGYVLTTAPIDINRMKFSADRPMFAMEVLMDHLDCKDAGEETPSELNCVFSPKAFHVTFSPCVHTYKNTSYSNAILNENVASTATLAAVQLVNSNTTNYYSLAGDLPSSPPVDCTPSDSPQGRYIQPTRLLTNGMRYADHHYNGSDGHDILYFDSECIYDFGFGPAAALYNSLSSVFFGKLSGQPNNLTTPRGIPGGTNGDQWLKALWANGTGDLTSVARYMDGVADAVSAAIREGGDGANSSPVTGIIMVNETCVGVFWAWLSLPAALLLFAIGFVLLAGFQSERYTRLGSVQSGRKPWKSSTLPLMWCGVEDSTRYQFPCLTDIKDMEETSDMVKVRLRRTVGGEEQGESGELGHSRGRWILQQESTDDDDGN
ncbi:hypothetical protein F4803DRAFT_527082 [Xylaria telfairii]|nr:hypothetical protein F4803DRAFT_527082 [Xylaria telfairii]